MFNYFDFNQNEKSTNIEKYPLQSQFSATKNESTNFLVLVNLQLTRAPKNCKGVIKVDQNHLLSLENQLVCQGHYALVTVFVQCAPSSQNI